MKKKKVKKMNPTSNELTESTSFAASHDSTSQNINDVIDSDLKSMRAAASNKTGDTDTNGTIMN